MFAIDARRMMLIVVGVVAVVLDGDEVDVFGIGPLKPVDALLHEEEREDGIAMGREPLSPLPLDVVVLDQYLEKKENSRF